MFSGTGLTLQFACQEMNETDFRTRWEMLKSISKDVSNYTLSGVILSCQDFIYK